MRKTMVRTGGLWLLLALLLSACRPVQALPITQSTATDTAANSAEAELEQANQAVIQRFYDEVINQKHMDYMEEAFDPQMVSHDLGPTPDVGALFAGIPDLHVTVDHWIIAGDMVTSIVTFSGTHTAEMMGVAPTNKPVTWTHVDVHRVKNGKIVEVWHNIPMGDILQQIGYQLVPPAQ